MDRFFVVSGGPGSGKTTLIEALRAAGHTCSVEAGRAIIQDQVAIDGPAVPWRDRVAFAELMLSWEMRSYRSAEALDGPVFFDRGVPDVAGYLALERLAIPAHVERAAEVFRYNATVFLAPTWPEIFHQDSERRQDLAIAERTHRAMVSVYARFGYRLVELPRAPVEERLRFVLNRLGLA